MTPEFVTRHLGTVYVAVPTTTVIASALLGVVSTYGSRIFPGPAIDVPPQEIGEFTFRNGVLLPHQQYLYGSSDTGEIFIVGKKLAGQDYSAWEAGYANFARLKSLTFGGPDAKTTMSWTFEAPKTSTSPTLLQVLIWILFGTICAIFLRYFMRKMMSRFIYKECDDEEEVLAAPSSDIDAEKSKLHCLWRSTLIGMYRERQCEILSLSKLAVHYYDSSRNLKKSLAKERKKKGEAKSAVAELKAEHAKELADRQGEIERLRQLLDTQIALAQNLESSDNAAAEAVGNEADTDDAKISLGGVEPDSSVMPTEAIAGIQDAFFDPPVVSPEEEHGVAEAMGLGDEDKKSATEQDDDTPAIDDQKAAPEMRTDEKPRRQRANRRADGTIRTPSHPDFVPREQPSSQLGDRAFRGSGRGGGRGHGNGRGNVRGNRRGGGRGDGDVRFGWRGGRGLNGYNEQYNRGRGQ